MSKQMSRLSTWKGLSNIRFESVELRLISNGCSSRRNEKNKCACRGTFQVLLCHCQHVYMLKCVVCVTDVSSAALGYRC